MFFLFFRFSASYAYPSSLCTTSPHLIPNSCTTPSHFIPNHNTSKHSIHELWRLYPLHIRKPFAPAPQPSSLSSMKRVCVILRTKSKSKAPYPPGLCDVQFSLNSHSSKYGVSAPYPPRPQFFCVTILTDEFGFAFHPNSHSHPNRFLSLLSFFFAVQRIVFKSLHQINVFHCL